MESQGLDPALVKILDRSPAVELDYRFVLDCLKNYKRPAMKLNHLLKIGALVRIKKGLFVIGERLAKQKYSLELLANKIYGPSYVSLEWAMQYYGLIPERVTEVTSVTTKRSNSFETPLGLFSYQHVKASSYPIGIDLIVFSEYQQALVATKEKALADLVVLRKGRTTSLKMMEEILFEDLRVEPEDLHSFDINRLQRIYQAMPHSALHFLIGVITRGKKA